MEKYDQELINKLMEKDPDFRKTYKTHKDYENKLSRLEKKPHLNAEETVEKNRLKKMKLSLKDEMESMIARHRRAAT